MLAERFGRELSEADVERRLLNEDLMTFAVAENRPDYRNTQHGMAQVLTHEAKHRDAVALLLEVCNLDINGTVNVKDERWRGVSEPPGQWMPKWGRLEPGFLSRLSRHRDSLPDIRGRACDLRETCWSGYAGPETAETCASRVVSDRLSVAAGNRGIAARFYTRSTMSMEISGGKDNHYQHEWN